MLGPIVGTFCWLAAEIDALRWNLRWDENIVINQTSLQVLLIWTRYEPNLQGLIFDYAAKKTNSYIEGKDDHQTLRTPPKIVEFAKFCLTKYEFSTAAVCIPPPSVHLWTRNDDIIPSGWVIMISERKVNVFVILVSRTCVGFYIN